MIGWYISRLSKMSPAEVFWRFRGFAAHMGEYLAYLLGYRKPIRMPSWSETREVLARYPLSDVVSSSDEASARMPSVVLGSPDGIPDWHLDSSTGRRAPRGFAPLLRTRDPEAVGDIKFIWELNRHQWLSARACSDPSDEGVAYVCSVLRDWLRANPYQDGVNWASPMELGLRVISWSIIFPRIAPVLEHDEGLRREFFRSVYEHLLLIRRHQSRFSSANNHVIGEMVGLYVGAQCFPFWSESETWRTEAKTVLERELLLQINPDGTNREQAIGYLLFVLELVTFCALLGASRGDPFTVEFLRRIRAMYEYLQDVRVKQESIPWYGDNDNGLAFDIGDTAPHIVRIFALGSCLFSAHAASWQQYATSSPTVSLFTRETGSILKQPLLPDPVPQDLKIYPDGGLVRLQNRNQSWKILFDCGPLGYLSTAAHGHADALSVWIASTEGYFITDSGTYCYHSHPEWRRYLRGTAAHNTARVDGSEQSTMRARFIWSDHAICCLLETVCTNEKITVSGEHDGYRRLSDPVVHMRKVSLTHEDDAVDVVDSFDCQANHFIEIFFHCHPAAHVVVEAKDRAAIEFAGDRFMLSTSMDKIGLAVVRGNRDPILGWHSQSFGSIEETNTVVMSGWIQGKTSIASRLQRL